MHAEDPSVEVYVPTGHAMHVDPSALYLPSGQGTHPPVLVEEEGSCPAAHCDGLDGLGLGVVPLEHAFADVDPSAVVVWPRGQRTHSKDPVVEVYVPTGHAEHLDPSLLNLPALHKSHSPGLVEEGCCPAPH